MNSGEHPGGDGRGLAFSVDQKRAKFSEDSTGDRRDRGDVSSDTAGPPYRLHHSAQITPIVTVERGNVTYDGVSAIG